MTPPPDPNQPTREEDDGLPDGPPPLPPLDDDFPAAPPPPPEGLGLVPPKLPPPPPPLPPPGGGFAAPPPSFPGPEAPIGAAGEALAEGPRLVAEFEMPGLAKAIAGIYIGAGIWCILWAILGFFVGMMSCPFLCVLPLAQLILGVFGIKHGSDMLGVKREAPHSGISGGLIACVILCDLISATCGVLCLVFAADGKVQQYYRDIGRIL